MSTVETMSGDVPGGGREGDWQCNGCHNRNYAFRSFCNRCKQPRVPGEGREGDWECIGCRNRNYAFRSFCNRCKQPRLLVDNNTPANSKWLPRVGDWICTGCTNNNYASREMCKKCGQPKEVAAMPAFAMPGASLQTYPHYFPRAQGGHEQKLNLGFLGNGASQQSLPLSSNWPLGGADRYGVQTADRYGVQPTSTWSFGGNQSNGVPYANQVSQSLASTDWHGDWTCTCGFQNYSSCAECKKCNVAKPAVYPGESYGGLLYHFHLPGIPFSCKASFQVFCPGESLGTKRLASEELVPYWDNKRLNAGQTLDLQHTTLGQLTSSVVSQTAAPYPSYPAGSSTGVQNLQVNPKLPQLVTMPPLPGKGARQWRDGDWMCTNCKNHNYAMRSHCNKCKTQREELTQSVSVA